MADPLMDNTAMSVLWVFHLPWFLSCLLMWPQKFKSLTLSCLISLQCPDCSDQCFQRGRFAKQRALCTEWKHQVCGKSGAISPCGPEWEWIGPHHQKPFAVFLPSFFEFIHYPSYFWLLAQGWLTYLSCDEEWGQRVDAEWLHLFFEYFLCSDEWCCLLVGMGLLGIYCYSSCSWRTSQQVSECLPVGQTLREPTGNKDKWRFCSPGMHLFSV